MSKEIDELRAVEIAKLFLLRCNLDLKIERPRSGIDADFLIKLNGSQARIAIEVSRSKNLNRALNKVARNLASEGKALPTILLAIHPHAVSGDLALLTSWNPQGELVVNESVAFVQYTQETLEQVILNVVRRFEEFQAIAS